MLANVSNNRLAQPGSTSGLINLVHLVVNRLGDRGVAYVVVSGVGDRGRLTQIAQSVYDQMEKTGG